MCIVARTRILGQLSGIGILSPFVSYFSTLESALWSAVVVRCHDCNMLFDSSISVMDLTVAKVLDVR